MKPKWFYWVDQLEERTMDWRDWLLFWAAILIIVLLSQKW